MSYYKCLCFIIFFVIQTALVFGQNSPSYILDSASGKLIADIRAHEKEHAYLVTDKAIYMPGENIWIKTFLLNSISQKISSRSKYLFVDMVNEKDSVIKIIILDAANKQLNSRIVIPGALPAGNYWLRAYTKPMAAGETASIAVKPIFIAGKDAVDNRVQKKKQRVADTIPAISFYPEGGSMMTGANSTVGVTALYNGNPLAIKGQIKDNHEAIASRFTTNEQGLAKFDIEPNGKRKYEAVVDWNGREINYPLPPFNFFGGQIAVTTQPDSYKLRILLEDSIFKPGIQTYLIGVSKDSLVFASIGRGLYEVNIDQKKLPEGITTFYLLDNNLKFLSERSIYSRDNKLHVVAKTDKQVYPKEGQVTLSVSITDSSQHALTSLIAIAVSDSILDNPKSLCPPAVLPLQGEDINNFFLAHNDCQSDADLDMLMLLKNNTYATIKNPLTMPATNVGTDSLLYIKGTISNDKSEPVSNQVLTLLSNSDKTMMYIDTTDSDGQFIFPVDNYKDSTQFAIQVTSGRGNSKDVNVIIDDMNYPHFSTPLSLRQPLQIQNSSIAKYMSSKYDVAHDDRQSLPPVNIKVQKKPVDYDVSKRVNSNSVVVAGSDIGENTGVGNAILNVGGMHLLNGMLVVNGLTSLNAPDKFSEPLLLVDGVQVGLSGESQIGQSSPVMSYLNSLNSKDIDFIEILKGPDGANYGLRGGNGVILINLRSTRRDLKIDDNKSKMFYAKGISAPAMFPISVNHQKDDKASLPDRRSTLFWNGSFLSDNKATITFNTSDVPATYKVTITGITIHGDIIYKTLSFQTK
ncbi:MAG: TonB-dependent receptor plug domain-containing protein [Ginsengibacter sp.]